MVSRSEPRVYVGSGLCPFSVLPDVVVSFRYAHCRGYLVTHLS